MLRRTSAVLGSSGAVIAVLLAGVHGADATTSSRSVCSPWAHVVHKARAASSYRLPGIVARSCVTVSRSASGETSAVGTFQVRVSHGYAEKLTVQPMLAYSGANEGGAVGSPGSSRSIHASSKTRTYTVNTLRASQLSRRGQVEAHHDATTVEHMGSKARTGQVSTDVTVNYSF